MEVDYRPAWLTWVASTTTCLRTVGIDCDQADVAGYSGYAFHLGVHENLCPSAPTMLEWSRLSRGPHSLGRATVEYRAPATHDRADAPRDAAARAAFELIRGELHAGRPCVLWGTYLPEFGVVVGIEGESYLVKTFKEVLEQPQPPIPFDAIDAPGGLYVLGFPADAAVVELRRDLQAILEALRQWDRPPYGPYRFGAGAYELWIEALRGRRADRFGCGYNAACYAEGRRFAHRFLDRMATRRPLAAELLRRAADAYEEAAEAMQHFVEVFPFTHDEKGRITDAAAIDRAVPLLERAQDAETLAMDLLKKITEMRVPRSE
jgi:hypothetical protein